MELNGIFRSISKTEVYENYQAGKLIESDFVFFKFERSEMAGRYVGSEFQPVSPMHEFWESCQGPITKISEIEFQIAMWCQSTKLRANFIVKVINQSMVEIKNVPTGSSMLFEKVLDIE